MHKLMSLQTEQRGQRSTDATDTNHGIDNRRHLEPLLGSLPFSYMLLRYYTSGSFFKIGRLIFAKHTIIPTLSNFWNACFRRIY